MKEGPDIARIAALIGDPARANILTALMDGRALTASELAEEAGVSLRTPYNLFGSKTDVLIALIEDGGFDPATVLVESGDILQGRLFAALRQIETFFEADEAFYREVYGGIMASDHPAIRESGVRRLAATCEALMHQAVASGELCRTSDSLLLGRHLAMELLAVLGMWGAGLLPNSDSMQQIRRSWCALLLQHCSDSARPALEAAYAAASPKES